MLSFPLSILLIPYALFLLIAAFFVFVTLRNLSRFRAEDVYSFGALLVFLVGLILIGYFSYQYLGPINWTEMVEIGLNFKNSF
ncbi:hypothetical protein ACFL29_01915 [Patescibacteria group bacterium]